MHKSIYLVYFHEAHIGINGAASGAFDSLEGLHQAYPNAVHEDSVPAGYEGFVFDVMDLKEKIKHKYKVGDRVRLDPAIKIGKIPEGRKNWPDARIQAQLLTADGAVKLDRDLGGMAYWNEEDLILDNDDTEIPIALHYVHVREIGRPVYHCVRLYKSYSREKGCIGRVMFEAEGSIKHVLADLGHLVKNGVVSKEQVAQLHVRMSGRNDGVVTSDLRGWRS